MKFYSGTFPNLTVVTGDFKIKFKDGVYETDNPEKCDALKKAGFKGYTTLNEVVEIEPIIELKETKSIIELKETEQLNAVTWEDKNPFRVPARWTMEKIIDFAKDNNIELPDKVKKADAITIIETSIVK